MRPAYLGGQGFARWQVEEERGRGAGSARESQSLESSASLIKSRWDGHRGKCGVDPRDRSYPGAPFTRPAGQARSCHLRIGTARRGVATGISGARGSIPDEASRFGGARSQRALQRAHHGHRSRHWRISISDHLWRRGRGRGRGAWRFAGARDEGCLLGRGADRVDRSAPGAGIGRQPWLYPAADLPAIRRGALIGFR